MPTDYTHCQNDYQLKMLLPNAFTMIPKDWSIFLVYMKEYELEQSQDTLFANEVKKKKRRVA